MSTDAAPNVGVPADTLEMRLYIARKHAGGLSADAAGRLVGVSGMTWRNWESGKPMQHRDLMLPEIARRLRLPEDYFEGVIPAVAPVTGSGPTPGGNLTNPRYGGVRRALQLVKSRSNLTPLVSSLTPDSVAA